jgi:DNA-binding NtrC family response regulator
MIRILLAGRDATSLSDFEAELKNRETQIHYLVSGDKALAAISAQGFDLLVADESLKDMTGLKLIKAVTTQQPLLNCALVSSLSPEEFHEATEGLGILMQLPPRPGMNEADQLLIHLNKILSFAQHPVTKES